MRCICRFACKLVFPLNDLGCIPSLHDIMTHVIEEESKRTDSHTDYCTGRAVGLLTIWAGFLLEIRDVNE